jgi:hypothetical protein
MVCQIAYLSLSHDDQQEVDRLTKAYQTPPGTKLALWRSEGVSGRRRDYQFLPGILCGELSCEDVQRKALRPLSCE